jgi:hypothetical protein
MKNRLQEVRFKESGHMSEKTKDELVSQNKPIDDAPSQADFLKMLNRLKKGLNVKEDKKRPHKISRPKIDSFYRTVIAALWKKDNGLDEVEVLNERVNAPQNALSYGFGKNSRAIASTDSGGVASVFAATVFRFWEQTELWEEGVKRADFKEEFWCDVFRSFEGLATHANVGEETSRTPSGVYADVPSIKDLPLAWSDLESKHLKTSKGYMALEYKKLDALAEGYESLVKNVFACFLERIKLDGFEDFSGQGVKNNLQRCLRVSGLIEWGMSRGHAHPQKALSTLQSLHDWMTNMPNGLKVWYASSKQDVNSTCHSMRELLMDLERMQLVGGPGELEGVLKKGRSSAL